MRHSSGHLTRHTIRHDHSVIFRSQVCLHPFTQYRRSVVDVFAGFIPSHKGDGFDLGVIADPVHSRRRAMNAGRVSASVTASCREACIAGCVHATHTLITPGGIPARSHSSAMIIVAPGSRSEGLTTRVLPVTVASAADQSTILTC